MDRRHHYHVYAGLTGLDPDVRCDKHKAGIQSSRFVRQYGLRLMPELYEVYNPIPYEGAREMDVALGSCLALHCRRDRRWSLLSLNFPPIRPACRPL